MIGEFARLAAFGVAGLALGLLSLASLRLNADLYLGGGLARPIALHLARLGLIGGALVLVAHQGAGPLLACAAGLVLARPIALRLFGGRS
jgi:hypothetical protein